MKKLLCVFLTPLLASSLAFGLGQVNISGKVIDQDSVPVAGARVALATAGYWTWSADDGTFLIHQDANPVRHSLMSDARTAGLSVVNGVLRAASVQDQAKVRVALFDINGRQARSLIRSGESIGGQGIDLNRELIDGLRKGAFVLRVEAGTESMTLRALVTDRGLQTSGAVGVARESSSSALAKSLAVADSLTVSRNSYVSSQKALESYSSTNLIVVLTATHLDFKLKVTGLAATYNVAQDNVALSWTPLDPTQFTSYRLYRTTTTTAAGVPNMKTMTSSDGRCAFSSSLSTFTDVPGLDNGVYYYCIRPVKVVDSDTAFGAMSSPAPVLAGGDVGFAINRGDLYTATDKCSLFVTDPLDTLLSVRFSQQYVQTLAKTTGERITVSFDDPVNPPSNVTLATLINAGWITSDATKLGTGVVRVDVPDFGAADPLNGVRTYQSMGGRVFPWTLRHGNGTKRVWAELTYKMGKVDTVMDAIEIAPWNISVRLGSPAVTDSLVKIVQSNNATYYFLHRPQIDFTISTGGDTTVSQDLDCWVMMGQNISPVYGDIADPTNAVIETAPRHEHLTGLGAAHNSLNLYRYSLDTLDTAGQNNLSMLRQTFRSPLPISTYINSTLIFKLRDDNGGAIMNRSCVPGSYWGPHPSIFVPGSGMVPNNNFLPGQGVVPEFGWMDPESVSVANQVSINQAKTTILRNLRQTDVQTKGVKEFVLITRFIGREFGDTRVAVSGGELMPGDPQSNRNFGMTSYFDWYPPNMNANRYEGNFINNGSIVNGTFSFAPAMSPSFQDLGNANITRIELVIARRPSGMLWNVSDNGSTADSISVQALYSMRNLAIPFPITQPAPTINNVGWYNIDPSDWPAGDYIMGVFAEDEYGNSGWAPIGAVTATSPYTNPWMITKR